MSVQVLVGDCRDTLKTLPERSVQCCVTSPPYFGLRSYLSVGHPDKAAEIGTEETPRAYVAALVAVFREVWRVLRDDGTVWLNLGDSYASAWVCDRRNTIGNGSLATGKRADRPNRLVDGLKEKDLIGIPWMVVFALRDDGWYLRSDIIWAKGNCMPESVQDRPTRSHEYIFLLSKHERYYYDALAIAEPAVKGDAGAGARNWRPGMIGNERVEAGQTDIERVTRNKRSVWAVNPLPYPESHFATFPPKLIEPCILAGTSEKGCCAACKAPWRRIVENTTEINQANKGSYFDRGKTGVNGLGRVQSGERYISRTTNWEPTCSCAAGEPIPCTVLDPFAGSGTTAMVATTHRRNAILCELNPEYGRLIDKRLDGVQVTLPFDSGDVMDAAAIEEVS